ASDVDRVRRGEPTDDRGRGGTASPAHGRFSHRRRCEIRRHLRIGRGGDRTATRLAEARFVGNIRRAGPTADHVGECDRKGGSKERGRKQVAGSRKQEVGWESWQFPSYGPTLFVLCLYSCSLLLAPCSFFSLLASSEPPVTLDHPGLSPV